MARGSPLRLRRQRALAAAGTRATHFYAASGYSTPARAALLTGWHPARLGILANFTRAEEHLTTNCPSLLRQLRAAGYATAHVGRWNLGGFQRASTVPGPAEHGFQQWFGREETAATNTSRAWLRNGEPVTLNAASLLDAQLAESLRLIDEFAARPEPFFLNLWLDTPREPGDAIPEAYLQPHQAEPNREVRRNRAILSQIDDVFGRLRKHLQQRGLTNTVIVFTGATGSGPGGNATGFRGEAGTLLEGGLRVPFIIHGPGKIRAGRSVGPVILATDVAATLAGAARIAPANDPASDAINFIPYFRGGVPAPIHELLVWQAPPQPAAYQRHGFQAPLPDEAVIYERWKLFLAAGRPVALFNLMTDSGEHFNRLDEPREAKALEKIPPQLEAWRAKNHPPSAAVTGAKP